MNKDTEACRMCSDQTPSTGAVVDDFRDLHRAMHDAARSVSARMVRFAREVNASVERQRVSR